ncbi:penicillin-binding protein 1A [Croceibacterium ferulae]|uniref:penicillin-binding protein 1A n=1 Tax=Croceibacterium ferulae TaxID=1854641 RepID=UPI000EAF9C12|nr:transglycosylase domain-containing protein [Croceibacterium ferulae]
MAEADTPSRYRLRRAQGVFAALADGWRTRPRLRRAIYALGVLLLLLVIGWLLLLRNLPDADRLLTYEPPLPSVVRGMDGEIVHSFARERRVQLQFKDFPIQLVNAYTSAEDKTFWTHAGVDVPGVAGAVVDYASKIGSGQRARGGSTITQQVAKNILVGNEYSISRKLREMVLAARIESVLTKQQIMELYLNEIPLGRRSFGVQAAARAYFDRDVEDLELHQMAFLAILPKAPEVYGRARNEASAIERRNWALDAMEENGHISVAEASAAKAQPLGLVQQRSEERSADAGYFLEEVRRQLIDRYGEQAEDGPNSVYGGGLWVRTSLDTQLQDAARDALRAGLLRFGGGRGWHGPVATIDPDNGSMTQQLASANIGIAYENWRIGVVTDRSGQSATIGFANGDEAPLGGLPDALKVGDVTAVSPVGGGRFRVRTVPEISGAFVAQDPATGRVLAMQGGFDFRLSSFNRATQAERQPGSTIKPFVYATGLDQGMTPATMVPDTSYCVYQGAGLGEKCFRNFSGGGGGSHTMRWGLEQSRNLMTVHIAADAGMPNVLKTFSRTGIGTYDQPYLSYALGAGSTTVLRMVNAYSALENHGLQHDASVMDYVQDRRGKVIWRADTRDCTGCNMPQWDGRPMPRLGDRGRQVMDARTAFQTVHMLEGVVQRGTATNLRDLDIPLFGKTGTTTGPTDVWFVGGSPDIVAGVYMGYDQPRSMGGWAQGGRLAAPIFKQFVTETPGKWSGRPFLAPAGVRLVRVDRRSGKRVFGSWPSDSDPRAGVIWEAFKPDSEPARERRGDRVDSLRELIMAQLRRTERASTRAAAAAAAEREDSFVEQQGGLY